MNVKEAARAIGCTRQNIYEMIGKGKLEVEKQKRSTAMGRKRVIDISPYEVKRLIHIRSGRNGLLSLKEAGRALCYHHTTLIYHINKGHIYAQRVRSFEGYTQGFHHGWRYAISTKEIERVRREGWNYANASR